MTKAEEIKDLAVNSTLPDDQRLQVLIHLVGELAERLEKLESKVGRMPFSGGLRR